MNQEPKTESPLSPPKKLSLQPMSADMTDPEKVKEYRMQPHAAPTPPPQAPTALPTQQNTGVPVAQPLTMSDQQIDQIAKNASRPEATGLMTVITYYIAGWLILSNGWSLYNSLSLLAHKSTRVAPGMAEGVILPLSYSVMILGLLAGIGLLFFRDIARKATLLYIGLNLIFTGYVLYETFRFSFFGVNTMAIAYYALILLFIPVNVVLFLNYKPTKQLFH